MGVTVLVHEELLGRLRPRNEVVVVRVVLDRGHVRGGARDLERRVDLVLAPHARGPKLGRVEQHAVLELLGDLAKLGDGAPDEHKVLVLVRAVVGEGLEGVTEGVRVQGRPAFPTLVTLFGV